VTEMLTAPPAVTAYPATAYSAIGNVTGYVFYLDWTIHITGGMTFYGRSGGATSLAGPCALAGSVVTSDINALYNNTRTIEFNAATAPVNVNFFDGNGGLLAYFTGAAGSPFVGVGGGSGSWSS
jgi:Rhodococcus equi virulence-associated protein